MPSEICGHPRPHKREGPADGHGGQGTGSLAGMAGCGRGRSEAEAISEGIASAVPTRDRISSSEKPCLVSSAPRWSSRRMSMTRPFSTAQREMACRRWNESTDCTSFTYGSTSFSLLVCRWPIKCHSTSGGISGTFAASSWGRFSPKTRCPAAYASISRATGWNLDTATRVTPSGSL